MITAVGDKDGEYLVEVVSRTREKKCFYVFLSSFFRFSVCFYPMPFFYYFQWGPVGFKTVGNQTIFVFCPLSCFYFLSDIIDTIYRKEIFLDIKFHHKIPSLDNSEFSFRYNRYSILKRNLFGNKIMEN